MSAPAVRTATAIESDRIFDTLVMAFASDPFTRWLWPEPQNFLSAWKRLLTPFSAGAFEAGTAFVTDGYCAASLWLPPGLVSDGDAMQAIMFETVSPERLEQIGAIMEQMDKAHPEGDIWYLPVIGCDPVQVGKGHGGALMRHALERVDEAGLPAYLESSNPRNVSLYQRHGFEIVKEISEGGSPVMTPMLRPAC